MKAIVKLAGSHPGVKVYEVVLEDGRGFTLYLPEGREKELEEHVKAHAKALHAAEVEEVVVE